MEVLNFYKNMKIQGKIILAISTLLVVTLTLVTMVVARQSGKWFSQEAKEKLDTAANIVLVDIENKSNYQKKVIDAIANDENVVSPASLVKDMIKENPSQEFDEAYMEMTKDTAMRLKKVSDIEGYNILKLYDANKNLLAFYSRSEKTAGWLIGNGNFSGMKQGAEVKSLSLPKGIDAQYSGAVPQSIYEGYNEYNSSITINTRNPAYEKDEGIKILHGFITVNTLLDDQYAEKMSRLSNTKINFFVGKGFSAGATKAYKKLSDKCYQMLASNYNQAQGKRENLLLDMDTKVGGEKYYEKLFPFDRGGSVIGAMSVLYSKKFAESKTSGAIMLLMVLSIASIVIGVVVAVLFSNRITNPLKEAVRVSNKLAEGDLTVEIDVKSKDETGQLLNTMKNTVEKLQDIIQRVAESTHQLVSTSEEVSRTTTIISDGAQKQNSQTEQIATSVEQMTATVMDIAKNANEAAEGAKNATEKASKGGDIVKNTVDGMNKIADAVKESAGTIEALKNSSEQIGEIIAVIDDIADQTNLLALNAAIEAARAGEQGRGFAVVADEVRKLAERTTKATKEIADMIKSIQTDTGGAVTSMEAGSKEVEKGVKSSNEAGDALKQIVEEVQKVTDMVQQIATSTEEQSAASEEINSNVETVASVAKETSTGIIECDNALQDLSKLAVQQRGIVDQFKLKEENHAKEEAEEV